MGFAQDQRGVAGSLRQQWEVMKAFLENPRCPGETLPVEDLEDLLADQAP